MLRKAWIPINIITVKSKGRNPVPVKCLFMSKEDPDRSIRLNSRSIVKGYMQVPGVKFTESFFPVATDTSTRILIGITLFHKEKGWVVKIYDAESAFLYPDMAVDILI